jgi:hypothetical protein
MSIPAFLGYFSLSQTWALLVIEGHPANHLSFNFISQSCRTFDVV